MADDTDRVRELERKIEDLRSRMPAHSVPPRMIQELEDLEDELAEAMTEARTVRIPDIRVEPT